MSIFSDVSPNFDHYKLAGPEDDGDHLGSVFIEPPIPDDPARVRNTVAEGYRIKCYLCLHGHQHTDTEHDEQMAEYCRTSEDPEDFRDRPELG